MIQRALRCLIAIAVAGAGLTVVVGSAAATGNAYCSGPGVNVVVDSGSLGAGLLRGCGQGTVAHPVFDSAGYTLGEIHTGGMAGFVCTITIAGKQWPSDGHCTGANGDGYWALFVASPGKPWSYANLGADSQPVSNGQTVSFAWQAPGSGQRQPATSPAPRLAPKPTPSPSHKPTSASTAAGITAGAKAARTPTPTAHASASTRATATAKPSPTPSATTSPSTWSSAAPAPSTTATLGSSSSGGGLPWWIPVGAVLALVGGAGVTWWRRRAGG